jgi:hypothetical protein
MDFTCSYFESDDTAGMTFVYQEVERKKLVEETHFVFDGVLVHGLEDHVAGAVGGVAGASYGCFTVIAGMAAEAALVDAPICGAVERQAAVFEFVDGVNGFAGQDFRGGLVYQVVTTFDGVVHVPLPMVFFLVAERGSYATLRCSSMGAGGVDFGQDGYAGVGQLHCGHQASTA